MATVKTREDIAKEWFIPPYSVLVKQRYSWNKAESYIPGVAPGSDSTDPKIIDLIDAFLKSVDNQEDVMSHDDLNGNKRWIENHGQEAYDNRLPLSEDLITKLVNDSIAEAELEEKVNAFNTALAEAEAIANKHNLTFNIYPAYGMGGTYDGEEGEWSPSSQSC